LTHLLKLFRGSARLGKRGVKGSVRITKTRIAKRKERQRQERFQRARTVRALRESNLSQEVQRREIAKLHRSRFTKLKERLRRKKEQPTFGKASFGTEAENQ
jgi:hypothetical protein